jgi:hypothetical protein
MKISFILIFFALSITTHSQSGDETRTLFGRGKAVTGYFLAPAVQIGKIAGSTAVIPGLGAGIIFSKRFSAGLFYKMTITENTPDGERDQLYLHGQWYGFKGDYSISPGKVIHLNFPLEISIGEIELDKKDTFENYALVIPSDDKWFFNVEPGIAIEINLLKYLKINLSAGYRMVSDVSFRNLTERDLAGFNFSSGVKIGIF